MTNFWHSLPKPFLALAPMEDVTDSVLRRILISVAAPDVTFTEFINVEGLDFAAKNGFMVKPTKLRREEIRQSGILQRLYFTESERPLVAQIWGSKPEYFYKAARIVKDLKFDGIDINMGCPQKKIVSTGGCAALIGEYELVKEIIQAVKEGAGGLPISVKTRIGKKKIITEEWIGFLLEQGLDAITVHGRTASEMSKVPAHWEEIARAVRLRDSVLSSRAKSRDPFSQDEHFDQLNPFEQHKHFEGIPPRVSLGRNDNSRFTRIIGNGDVKNYAEAMEKVDKYGVDGVMIGRGIFENVAAFKPQTTNHKSQKDMIDLFGEHIELYRDTWGDKKSFYVLRKFVKMYINGWDGASKMREKLMKAENYEELLEMLHS